MSDPLLPHLLDIISDPASEGLILAGGFGIRLKQQHLRDTGTRTLMERVPEARATQDLDFFLRIALFLQKEQGRAIRTLLDGLSYQEYTPQFQFGKPLNAQFPDSKVKVDFLARETRPEEPIRTKDHRVGSGSDIGLHGYETPEGFAVEDSPIQLKITGLRSDGTEIESTIFVPHPYAWINMKVKAAYDWLQMERGVIPRKENREKHAFDVYVLVAMLTQTELEDTAALAPKYADVPIAAAIQDYAEELYGSPDSPGFREATRQAGYVLDHVTFREALRMVLGVAA